MLSYQFRVDFNRPSTCFDMLMFPITITPVPTLPTLSEFVLKQNTLGKPTEPIDSAFFNLDFETQAGFFDSSFTRTITVSGKSMTGVNFLDTITLVQYCNLQLSPIANLPDRHLRIGDSIVFD